MKVILLENVRKIGSIGEIIDVKRGFARNYLISKKKALFESNENMESYINLNKFINIIFRNKNFIFLVTLLITSISIISTYFNGQTVSF